MSDLFSADFTRVFSQPDEQGLWMSAVQLSGRGDVVEHFATLIGAALRVSRAWDSEIRIDIEPGGDSVETGHLAVLEVDSGTSWVRLWPAPLHHQEWLPPFISDWLVEQGWFTTEAPVDPVPQDENEYRNFDLPCKECGEHIAMPQLTLESVGGDTLEFGRRIVAAVRAVMGPNHDCWFLWGTALAHAGGHLSMRTSRWRDDHPDWSLRIAELLPPTATNPAIWPAGGFQAKQCCQQGMHQFHEGPCSDPDPLTEETSSEDW